MSIHSSQFSLQKNQDRIIRANEVVSLTGLSRSTLWRLERMEGEGNFPARRKLSPGAVGWLLSEVLEWLNNRQIVTSSTSKEFVSSPSRGRKSKPHQTELGKPERKWSRRRR